jgi:hypothetical protein
VSNQRPPAKPSGGGSISGTVVLCLFSLPFAGVGTFTIFKSFDLLFTPGKARDGLMLGLFALTFSTIGYGLLFGAIAGYRAERRKQARRAEHPDEPWRWREDWAKGRAYASTRSLMWFTWAFALFWNGISTGVAIGMLKGHAPLVPAIIFGVIFPLVGLALLVWAVRVTIVWNKFGLSTFKMLSVPGVIGGSLSGAIETSVKLRPREGFHLRLACVNRVRIASGKNSSTQETILWQTEKTINEDLLDEPHRSGIPVSFQIPADALPTDDTTPTNTIVWRLIAQAKLPGVDYSATFEVPVFRTAQNAGVVVND